jgi:hypothetical protein
MRSSDAVNFGRIAALTRTSVERPKATSLLALIHERVDAARFVWDRESRIDDEWHIGPWS